MTYLSACSRRKLSRSISIGAAALALTASLSTASAWASQPLHDPNLPTVPPQALRQVAENRARQQIITASLAPYADRCVCPYQAVDAAGRSCRGRHEVVVGAPAPVCYPGQVTQAMISQWQERRATH